MGSKVALGLTAIIGVIVSPLLALVLAPSFSQASITTTAITALCGVLASIFITRQPKAKSLFDDLRNAKPSAELAEKWQEIGTKEISRRKGRGILRRKDRDGKEEAQEEDATRVENAGITWIFRAIKLLVGAAWAGNKWATLAILGALLFVALAPLSGIPGLAALGQSTGLYLLCAALFTGITFITEPQGR